MTFRSKAASWGVVIVAALVAVGCGSGDAPIQPATQAKPIGGGKAGGAGLAPGKLYHPADGGSLQAGGKAGG